MYEHLYTYTVSPTLTTMNDLSLPGILYVCTAVLLIVSEVSP